MMQSTIFRSFSSSYRNDFHSPPYPPSRQGRLKRSNSVFTNTSDVSKEKAFYILYRHIACNYKSSMKAMKQINIKHVESHHISHLCLKTIKEIRLRTEVEKPYKGLHTVRYEHYQNYNIADIWTIPVDKTGNETSKRIEIPGTLRVQSCNDCGAYGRTKCRYCSGACAIWCAGCSGKGYIQSTVPYTESYLKTSKKGDIRRSVFETCFSCNGQGNTKCACIKGRIECLRCAGWGKLETYAQLEVTWETTRNDYFHGMKEITEDLLSDFLSSCTCDGNLYRQAGKYVPPLSNKDCSVWELREASKAFSEKHTTWANCKGKKYQQEQTVDDIPLYKVWYDYKGTILTFLMVGQYHKVHARTFPHPRPKKLSDCKIM